MSLAIEERAERLRTLLNKSEVQEAMKERCEEEHHAWENCCSVFLEVYQRCKWCQEVRR